MSGKKRKRDEEKVAAARKIAESESDTSAKSKDKKMSGKKRKRDEEEEAAARKIAESEAAQAMADSFSFSQWTLGDAQTAFAKAATFRAGNPTLAELMDLFTSLPEAIRDRAGVAEFCDKLKTLEQAPSNEVARPFLKAILAISEAAETWFTSQQSASACSAGNKDDAGEGDQKA